MGFVRTIKELIDAFNGRIANDNIKSSAGIELTKLENRVWTDWSGSLAPTGYAGSPTVVANYCKIGKIIFLWINITGTSNAVSLNCTLPYAAERAENHVIFKVTDNSVAQTNIGMGTTGAASTTLTCKKDAAATNFTNANTKAIQGLLIYESD